MFSRVARYLFNRLLLDSPPFLLLFAVSLHLAQCHIHRFRLVAGTQEAQALAHNAPSVAFTVAMPGRAVLLTVCSFKPKELETKYLCLAVIRQLRPFLGF